MITYGGDANIQDKKRDLQFTEDGLNDNGMTMKTDKEEKGFGIDQHEDKKE